MENDPYLFIFIAGAVGALVRICLDSGKIIFPAKVTGGLSLGFIGSLLVGGFVGVVVDGSLLTAAMAGFVGHTLIDNLAPQIKVKSINCEAEKETQS